MTAIVQGRVKPAEDKAPPGKPAARTRPFALLGICALAGVLYAWDIGAGDYGNSFYAAAAKSMTQSFPHFLFGAFDPYGMVSTDKPPMALWPQAISVAIFGFHSWSLILPQVIEGVLAVFLLHRTVRLWKGENVALLAALILALTPITVALNRDNNTDAMLVLLMVAAAYAFTRSVHSGTDRSRTRWLLFCAFLIGCGFVAKWMEAWIVVPGFALAFMMGSTSSVRKRITDLVAAGGVLAVSSFWWPVLHDLWPGRKPYMGASMDGSALDVVFGYNGFGKIFDFGQTYNDSGINVALGIVGMSGGDPDIGRMFIHQVGGQISWLLPLCLIVLAVVGAAGYRRLWYRTPGERLERNGWLTWGSWLLVTVVVFSFVQGIWHPYYTTYLGPAVAAVSAAGLAMLWDRYKSSAGYGWILLPFSIAVTAIWTISLSARDAHWNGWTRWVVLAAAVVSVAGLVLARLDLSRSRWQRPALVLGVVSVLLTPAVWSAGTAIEHGTNGGFPSAGPPNTAFMALLRGELGPDVKFPKLPPGVVPPGLPPGVQLPDFENLPQGPQRGGGIGGPELSPLLRQMLDYAVANSGEAEIKLALEGGGLVAGAFIIQSDEMIIGMGGYLGADNAPSVGQLEELVSAGKLKFIVSAAPGARRMGGIAAMGGEIQAQRVAWVQQNCAVVDPGLYGGTPVNLDRMLPIPNLADSTLYSC